MHDKPRTPADIGKLDIRKPGIRDLGIRKPGMDEKTSARLIISFL